MNTKYETDYKTRPFKGQMFEVNEDLAGLVPMAIESEQDALTEDIRENGQRDPIVLWKGKIVDGRCRYKSTRALGIGVSYRELDDNLTEDEVAIFVKSVNTRRNLTTAQKAMSAAKSKVSGKDSRSIPVIAKSWGIGKTMLDAALYIYRNDMQIAIDLFNGKSVYIINKDGQESTSSRIMAVHAHLTRQAEKVPIEPKVYNFDAKRDIYTQAGKDYYFDELKRLKEMGQKVTEEWCKMIGELANFKFKLGKDGVSERDRLEVEFIDENDEML